LVAITTSGGIVVAMVIYAAIHLGSMPDEAVLDSLADFICGDEESKYPVYRSSAYLTRFFQALDINAVHDGSTRKWWVLEVLKVLQPSDLERVILRLVDLKEYRGNREQLKLAVQSMNHILAMDNFKIGFNGTAPQLGRGDPIEFDADEFTKPEPPTDESSFLNKQFSDHIQISELDFDQPITAILQTRVDEVQAAPRTKISLGAIFLLGSTLEGMLLATALKNQRKFMTAAAAPKDRSGTVHPIHQWKLASLIDVAHQVGLLGQDVKKFSHVLRDFRNYIHPYEQLAQRFDPDQRTVDICWQVFKAAFEQLKEKR
jgi:hypothetical protein